MDISKPLTRPLQIHQPSTARVRRRTSTDPIGLSRRRADEREVALQKSAVARTTIESAAAAEMDAATRHLEPHLRRGHDLAPAEAGALTAKPDITIAQARGGVGAKPPHAPLPPPSQVVRRVANEYELLLAPGAAGEVGAVQA